jgi:hypothetical protein
MKPTGIVLSSVGLVAAAAATVVAHQASQPLLLPAAATVLSGLLLTWWITRITPAWVRLAAYAYAERLLAACDTLNADASDSGRRVVA